MFAKILKIFLIFALIILIALMLFGAVLVLNWSWWTVLFAVLGVAGLIIGGIFLKKLWLRRRERAFVDQVIQQDNLRIKALAEKERERSQELQKKWLEAVETLKKSHLKRQGNPLYVLPWYLVIGESGSGKTTAIQSARLASPFAEYGRVSGITGTRNCDWWFFESSIIIDTAGRYTVAVDETRDHEEWQEFLPLLARYRKREPLNGLIVTVSADKLLTAGTEDLKKNACAVRNRINELMIALRAKFPVYLLVTKCDLIQGMLRFCDRLPETTLSQAMGVINVDFAGEAEPFIAQAFTTISERLRNLRLLLLHESDSDRVAPSLLLFPDEFLKLGPGLKTFAGEVFQTNPYQESAIFRGIFFSSGRQEGTPYSHFLQNLGLIGSKEILPGTNRGLFLHDFFAGILPKDRRLFAPTQRAVEWNRLTRNLGLTSWVAVLIALCGLLSFSFVKNLAPVRKPSAVFLKTFASHRNIPADLQFLTEYRHAVLDVEESNRNWWFPRLGLDESLTVERGLKSEFSSAFKQKLLLPLDEKLTARIDGFSAETSDQTVADYVTYLLQRIELLNARLEDRDPESYPQINILPFKVLIDADGQVHAEEDVARLASLYMGYLTWMPDREMISREIVDQKLLLKKIIEVKGETLRWLVPWANQQASLEPVKRGEFWGVIDAGAGTAVVARAFTKAGRDRIYQFLQEMEDAFADSGFVFAAGPKKQFEAWYAGVYFDAWLQFAKAFGEEAARFLNSDARRPMAQRISLDTSPYFVLLDRMAEELEPLTQSDHLPAWVQQLFRYQLVKNEMTDGESAAEQGLIDKAAKKSKKLFGKLGFDINQISRKDDWKNKEKAVKSFQEYMNALQEIVPMVDSRAAAFTMTTEVFNDDPLTSQSRFLVARRFLSDFKSQMIAGPAEQNVILELLQGPFDYLWAYAQQEADCQLQSLWEQQVLAEISDTTKPNDMLEILFGEDGCANKFIKGPAAPFLGRSKGRGYYAKQVMNGEISFKKEFLSFLSRGTVAPTKVQPFYTVVIEGLPTGANPGAPLPQATHLELQCSDRSPRLDNYNFPVKENFIWVPDACGDTVLQIEIGTLVLTKRYTGQDAFPLFIEDFKAGQRLFHPEDFPEQKDALTSRGIQYIRVNYRLSGYQGVLDQLRPNLGNVPSKIVSCRD